MNYLFVIQGEGRGHLTQAIALAQLLRRHGHQVSEVLVGKARGRVLPPFFEQQIGCPIHTYDAPAFDYGKVGKRGNLTRTVLRNITPAKLLLWRRSIKTIAGRVGACRPDVVVNLYELLFGVAHLTHRFGVPVVSIAHQFLVDHPGYAHRSRALWWNNRLCALGSKKTLALSFYPLPDAPRRRLSVVPPLLRREVFTLQPRNEGHILAYVLNAAYADELKAWHRQHPVPPLHLFWDKKEAPETLELDPGLTLHRLDDQKFLHYMATSAGYATTAGFESVCEAIYLGKPALLIPAHLEQQINAADAAAFGAGVVSAEFDLSKLVEFIPGYRADTAAFRAWVQQAEDIFLRHLTSLM